MTLPVRYAKNGDVCIAYEVFGDPQTGEPLLLIMGLDFQMVWWPDDLCEELVARGYCVVRYDPRDTGLSTHFASPPRNPFRALLGRTTPAYTGTDMVDDAVAVMDAVGWSSATLMGGSLGSGTAQGLAGLYPNRVRALVLAMGIPLSNSATRPLRYIRFGVFKEFRGLVVGGTRDEEIETLTRIYRAVASPAYPFPEAWVREAAGISYDRCPRDPGTTSRQLAAGRATRWPAISGITVPTLVINGSDDPLIKPSGGRDTAKQIPGATFIEYPGMGHTLPQELWSEIIDEIQALTTRTRS